MVRRNRIAIIFFLLAANEAYAQTGLSEGLAQAAGGL
jgi:hypothetical protein